MKKFISLHAAKVIILTIFTLTLILTILFGWSAYLFSAAAADTNQSITAAQYDSATMLRQIELLQSQIDSLETELNTTQSELTTINEQNQLLIDEQEQLVQELSGNMSLEYAGNFTSTAYCCETYDHICGGNGVTASGTVPTPGLTIAADWGVLPAGTWVYIEGIGVRRVEDRGSAIVGNKLDIALATHAEALTWGNRSHNVWILTWGDVQS